MNALFSSVEQATVLRWDELYCRAVLIINNVPAMVNLTTSTLRRALDLQERIEDLQRELTRILGKSLSLSGLTGESAVVTVPPPRGRKPGRPAKKTARGKRKSARPVKRTTESGPAKERTSPFKGKRRPSSPSGPLAPAVHKVMKRAGAPMNVDAILQGLKLDKYVWKVSEPKKNLAARVYTMPGLKKVGAGMFSLKK